jgi:hypothetical protein
MYQIRAIIIYFGADVFEASGLPMGVVKKCHPKLASKKLKKPLPVFFAVNQACNAILHT